ncbi:MAG TPA: hypothetical protein VF184_10335 [Phycisphaeraceae bacterium]
MVHAQTMPTARPELDWQRLPDLPDTIGYAGPFAGVSNGALIVAGGANFPDKMPWEGGRKVWHDQLYVLESPTSSWKTQWRLPRPLGYGVSVTTPQGAIFVGGCDDQQNFADVYRVRWEAGRIEFETLPPLPEPVSCAAGAVLANTLYVAGGQPGPDPLSGPSMHQFWALDLTNPHAGWRVLEPWPGPERFYAVATAADGAFYLLSGIRRVLDASGQPTLEYLRDAYRYTPGPANSTAGRWERLPDLPRPNAAAATPAPVLDDRFIVLLGNGADGAHVDVPMSQQPGFGRQILIFDLSRNQWTQAGELPFGRAAVPLTTWRNRWVVPSGEVRAGVRSPHVYWAAPQPLAPNP